MVRAEASDDNRSGRKVGAGESLSTAGATPRSGTFEEVLIPTDQLRQFARDIFIGAGFLEEHATIQAEVLVWANLRGIDSHGVLRIPSYVEAADKGWTNVRPNIQVLRETSAMLLVDVDFALGPVGTIFVMQRVIRKAREVGIGWGLIRNATHQGAISYYSMMAASQGLAGLAIACSPPNMAPYGAKAVGVHNSPISIAVPARRHPPLVLDMATSVAAGGRLRLAIDKGVPIPEGWALTKDGYPTTDATQASILLPFAGPKGSGLALMFECLSSLMAGNPLLVPILSGRLNVRRLRQNGIVAAIDLASFLDLKAYTGHVDELADHLKALPRAEGFDEILLPGEAEYRLQSHRARNGIPVPAGTIRKLRLVAERFGVSTPAELG